MKIYKEQLHKQIKPFIKDDKIQVLDKTIIEEFQIGKSFFYKTDNFDLLNFHNWLNKALLDKIYTNNASKGFEKDKSYLDFFEPHIKNYNFLRLDIKSFFHSINIKDIGNSLKIYFDKDSIEINDKKYPLISFFIYFTTYKIPDSSENQKFVNKRVLPMGFKTSPKISNIVFRPLDIQIQKLCIKNGITYTRYADDMLFSSKKDLTYIHTVSFIEQVSFILNQMNFQLNSKKTIKAKHTISLNGYTIDSSKKEFRISNKKLIKIKKLIYMKTVEKKSSQDILKKLFPDDFKKYIPKFYEDQLSNKIKGYRSYIISFIKFDKKYKYLSEDTKDRYIKLINQLEKIIKY